MAREIFRLFYDYRTLVVSVWLCRQSVCVRVSVFERIDAQCQSPERDRLTTRYPNPHTHTADNSITAEIVETLAHVCVCDLVGHTKLPSYAYGSRFLQHFTYLTFHSATKPKMNSVSLSIHIHTHKHSRLDEAHCAYFASLECVVNTVWFKSGARGNFPTFRANESLETSLSIINLIPDRPVIIFNIVYIIDATLRSSCERFPAATDRSGKALRVEYI